MPDITMCKGWECPYKGSCHRYLAEPNPRQQAYFINPPISDDGICEFFWGKELTEPLASAMITPLEIIGGCNGKRTLRTAN